MIDIPLNGALAGLEIADASHLSRFKRAVDAGQQTGWSYYFPYVLARNRSKRSASLLVEDEGSICVFLWRQRKAGPKLDVLLAPMPMNAAVLRRCLERANEFNGDRSARIMRIDEKDRDAVSSLEQLRIKERGEQYLYSPKAYENLSGGKFRTLRRMVARVESGPKVEVLPYAAHHAAGCRELLDRWSERHREDHGTGGGVRLSRCAIDLAQTLPETDLFGEIVLVEGRLSAFAFGGEIRPGVACFFDAKSDIEVSGLSYFHRYRFLSKLHEFDMVNDGSNVGRDGLAQLKESLRPIAMHAEFGAKQRADSSSGN
jgi:hypothetical protein